MVHITFFFYFMVVLFGIIGASRGWAKEMLVTFSAMLALFLITVLETYVSVIRDSFVVMGPAPQFWLRFVVIILLSFFGYQTPNLPKISGSHFAREKLQDALLGFVLGAFNAFLIVGSIWYFMSEAGYPFRYITPPISGDPLGDAAIRMMGWMAPGWLVIPYIYFAIGVAFIFVIVVFL